MSRGEVNRPSCQPEPGAAHEPPAFIKGVRGMPILRLIRSVPVTVAKIPICVWVYILVFLGVSIFILPDENGKLSASNWGAMILFFLIALEQIAKHLRK